MKIRDLARAGGVSVQAVRDYETVGLLPPVPRLVSGHRAYTARHLAALLTVRALVDAGYTRAELKTMMAAIHRGDLNDALVIVDRHHARIDQRQVSLATEDVHPTPPSTLVFPVTIGKVAAMVGVLPSTVRFWESMGLVEVERSRSSGYREFGPDDIRHLMEIRRLRLLGLSWEAIRAAFRDPARTVADSTVALRDERIANARATATVWAYATITDDDIGLVAPIFEALRRTPGSISSLP